MPSIKNDQFSEIANLLTAMNETMDRVNSLIALTDYDGFKDIAKDLLEIERNIFSHSYDLIKTAAISDLIADDFSYKMPRV